MIVRNSSTVFFSMLYMLANAALRTSAFVSHPTRNIGCVSGSHPPTTLNLHPDQALELEQAASEMLKSSFQVEDEPVEHQETISGEKIDDTKNSLNSSHLSAASTSSPKPVRQWWSTTFTFVRRTR